MKDKGMTLIVKTITRYTVWLIALYGIYIILHGHLTPGGGFAGGVIIALALLNIMLAYGSSPANGCGLICCMNWRLPARLFFL